MIENRSIRLRFLQGYLDRGNPNSLSVYDPSIISLVSSWKNNEDIVCGLKSQEVVTSEYTEEYLVMDLWYLDKNKKNLPNIQRNLSSLKEFEQRVLFQVVIQCLIDIYIGRPCDEKLWRSDVSPDFRRCSGSMHLCGKFAEEYLNSLGLELDSYMGLPNGCISGLIREIKRGAIAPPLPR